ncbi:MAG: TIGR03905 family TSCPD domain-containing protein [Firmicutes bacterium]|nr:TIGR03905 family TSCPD domain-containing protein [Bacillota bacterium]
MKKVIETRGVCASGIEYDIDENGIVRNVKFLGGCAGNGYGISALVEGMHAEEVAKRLSGIPCRMGTSCPDQLAKALMEE